MPKYRKSFGLATMVSLAMLALVFSPAVPAEEIDFKLNLHKRLAGLMAMSLGFSPDGRSLVLSGVEGGVDPGTGRMQISFSGEIAVVDLMSLETKTRLGQGSFPGAVMFTSDGHHVVGVIGSTLSVWKTIGGAGQVLRGDVEEVAFCEDGRLALVAGKNGQVELFDLESHQALETFSASEADGRLLCVGPGEYFVVHSTDNVLMMKNLKTGEDSALGEWVTGGVKSLSRGGDLLAVGGSSGAVSVWNLATREKVAEKHVVESQITVLALLPGRSSVAYVGPGGAYFWSFGSEPEHFSIGTHETPVLSVAVTADPPVLATSSADGIRFFDIKGLQPAPGGQATAADETPSPKPGAGVCDGPTLETRLKGDKKKFSVRIGTMLAFRTFEACAAYDELAGRTRKKVSKLGYGKGDVVLFRVTGGEATALPRQ